MRRVLVIEDHPDNLRLMGYSLLQAGYEVMAARTGEKGVRLAQETRPNFIITDINLPDMDGYEVVRRIRAAAASKSIPIIAITSHAMAGDRERIVTCGCTGYFEKPIDPLTIMDQIHQLLAESGHPVEKESPACSPLS